MNESEILRKTIDRALTGKGSHVEGINLFQNVDWKLTGVLPGSAPHTIFQLLNHILFWQEWALKWLDGAKPPIPRHAAGSWPGAPAPAGRKEWDACVKRQEKALGELQARSQREALFTSGGHKTKLEMLQVIASHNSYHFGQVVLLRQMLGVWPPPGGGLTW